jgi:DNA-binding transcriptional LysR family regulator
MEPTPRAREIGGEIIEALDRITMTLNRDFDPKRLNRAFRIGLVSFSGFYLLPALIDNIRFEAPNVQLLPEHTEEQIAYNALENSEIDFALGLFGDENPRLRRVQLLRSNLKVIMRQGHPIKSQKVTLPQLSAYSHIRVPIFDNIDKILEARGLKRRFAMTSSNPLGVPFLLARSDMLAILPSRLAMVFASVCQLREAALAFDLPECNVELIVHPRHDADPSFRWLTDCIVTLAREISKNMRPVADRRSMRPLNDAE